MDSGSRSVSYYQVELLPNNKYAPSFPVSDHINFIRMKDVDMCLAFLKTLHDVTALPVLYSDETIVDILYVHRDMDESSLQRLERDVL